MVLPCFNSVRKRKHEQIGRADIQNGINKKPPNPVKDWMVCVGSI